MARFQQPVRTIFGGVSRQPPVVRRDNQVEEGDNALFSVVSGGFEKRPCTQLISELSGPSASLDYAVHAINRDPTEQYILMIGDGDIHVHDAITGAAKTVTVADQDHYFCIESSLGAVATIVAAEETAWDSSETQFSWTYTSSGAGTGVITIYGSATGAFAGEETTLDTLTGTSDTGTTTISSNDHKFIKVAVTTAEASQTFTLYATFKSLSYLVDTFPEEVAFVTIADYTFITNRSIITRMREASATDAVNYTVQTFADLPSTPADTEVAKVVGDDGDDFDAYYLIYDSSTGVWTETVKGGQHDTFDATTMPHVLKKNADGTFTFDQATYAVRTVGDETVTPQPAFIGHTVNDLTWYRNRIGFAADEHVILSGIDTDVTVNGSIRFWPSHAYTTLATDPIERTAGTERVAVLRWLSPFRKLLFATADEIQFELQSGNAALTSETASMDATTFYSSSPNLKPIGLGDVLYFGALTPRASAIFEYFYEDTTVSNTAADVTKHIVDYIPQETFQIAGDPLSSTLFALSSGENNSVFVYTTFWDGDEKLQSAWSRWKFGDTEADAFIHGIAVLSNYLVLVIERPDGIFLEQVPVTQEASDADLGWIPQLDQREVITGVYDSGTDLTTFTVSYEHDNDLVIITGGDGFAVGKQGAQPTLSYPSATTATASGDWSDGEVYAGRPYTMSVELSRVYARDSDGTPDVYGSVKLQKMVVNYTDSGYFKITVDPGYSRDTREWEFTGRTLGDSNNQVGVVPIDPEGQFTASPLAVDAKDAVITISNDSPYPSIISSYVLIGTQDDDVSQDRTGVRRG